jgi:hypothetical protein
MSPYKKLATEIVMQAITDFRKDIKIVKGGKRKKDAALKDMQDILEFFKSDWFTVLTDLSPDLVIDKLKEEASNDI